MRLLDLFFPPKCAACGVKCAPARLCPACLKDFSHAASFHGTVTLDSGYTVAYAFNYTGAVREIIHNFKFNAQPYFADMLGKAVAGCAMGLPNTRFDLVTFVPTHPARIRERGYDQAFLIAKWAAKALGLPCVKAARKAVNNRPQSSLSAAERAANARGAYSVPKTAAVAGKNVLLVDDVLTTGATLTACADALMSAGAEAVYGAAAAHGVN